MPVTTTRRNLLAFVLGATVSAAGPSSAPRQLDRATCGEPVWNWQGIGRCAQRANHTGPHY